ncbi:MAG: KH domain-containing protein [Gammaproteobacteria bacterium]|nr:KH domain-containing protein [Gammaproteobacteria bacterium]
MKKEYAESMDLEEAKREIEQKLKATEDQIEFEVQEEVKLTTTIYHVTGTLAVDYPKKGLEYLQSILKALNINAMITMKKREREVKYIVTSEENPLLIGRGGKNLEAIQTLVRIAVNGDIDEADEQYHVTVDCGGYKEQRNKQLEILATKCAKEVAETKTAAHLDPMNAYERRVIHEKLSDWRDVYTESEGEGKERHIVIKPRKK